MKHVVLAASLLLACQSTPAPEAGPPSTQAAAANVAAAAVAAPDRSEADRALDAGRKPAEWLAFFGIAPGMRVAEIGAGGGYTSELLARIVGPEGHVYGHNTPFVLERFAEAPWTERLQKPIMANVTRVDAEFDAPLPAEAQNLDAVLNILFYHDTVWMKADRDAMNRAIFAALKPGGVYGVIDHSAAPGAGDTVTETLHRIEQSVVVQDLERVGFVLAGELDVLRDPSDTRDWSASPRTAGERRGQSDRFILKLVKPEGS